MIFVTAYLDGTHGTAKSARDFLRALLACLPDVKVISPTEEIFPSEICGYSLSTPQWFQVPQNIRLPKKIWRIRPSILNNWYKDREREKKIKALSQYETVIVNGWASYNFWSSIKDRFKGNRIMLVRESLRHFSGEDRQTQLQHLIDAFSSFDKLIFVSENVRQEWLGFPELKNKESVYLPNCCEEEEAKDQLRKGFDTNRKLLGYNADEFIVVYPGSIEYRKGQDLLIKILPDLISKIINFRLLLIGDITTQWGQDLLRNISSSPYSKQVTYLKPRPKIFDIMSAANILAFPSRAEAMPRTILEAMALKLPVVASSVDGIPEFILDDKTGILFEPEDSQGLLEGILKIAYNPMYGNELATNGYSRYWDVFSRQKQFERMNNILLKLEE